MSLIEFFGALLGIINVGLIIRRSPWNYPFGLMMVLLYGWIFFEAKLYSEALLQVYFFGMQLYGWWFWLRHRLDDGTVAVETMTSVGRIQAAIVTLLIALMLGSVMDRWTDAALPYLDASVTAMSFSAQWMLARKWIENWGLWILVDLLSIGIYLQRELYWTTGLYVVFLALAITGGIDWWSKLQVSTEASTQ